MRVVIERFEDGKKVELKLNLKDKNAERVTLRHNDLVRVGETIF